MPPVMQTHQNRSTKMNLMHEDLARAQMRARLGEAQQLRRGYQLALARRLSRKAEASTLKHADLRRERP